MTIAGELAAFLTRTRYEEITSTALYYAAMMRSCTAASAAKGSTLSQHE